MGSRPPRPHRRSVQTFAGERLAGAPAHPFPRHDDRPGMVDAEGQAHRSEDGSRTRVHGAGEQGHEFRHRRGSRHVFRIALVPCEARVQSWHRSADVQFVPHDPEARARPSRQRARVDGYVVVQQAWKRLSRTRRRDVGDALDRVDEVQHLRFRHGSAQRQSGRDVCEDGHAPEDVFARLPAQGQPT